MKYLEVLVSLFPILLGVLIGSFIHVGGGNGAILGGLLGVILCCILFWLSALRRSGSAGLDDQHSHMSGKEKQGVESELRMMRDAQALEGLRRQGLNHRF